MNRKLFLRVDGDRRIGWGRMLRCLALAEHALSRGVHVTVLCRFLDPFLKRKVQALDVSMQVLEQVPDNLDQHWIHHLNPADILVVDLPAQRETLVHAAQARSVAVLVMDDLGTYHGRADILLNQNMDAHRGLYDLSKLGHALTGPRYALIEQAFRRVRRRDNVDAHRQRLFVSLGGAATIGMLCSVLSHLQGHWRHEVCITSATLDAEELRQRLRSCFPCEQLRIMRDHELTPEIMQSCFAAVAGGGTTCWQLACMGVPMVIVQVARDQRENARALDAHGCAWDLGWWENPKARQVGRAISRLSETPERREHMSRKAKELVDGCGAERVMDAILSTAPLQKKQACFFA